MLTKKSRKNILESGWFSFPLGYLKLSTLNKLEIKKTKYIKSLLLGYYKLKSKSATIPCSDDQKPRVFFLMNILPLWEKSTSNFLKIIADIAKYYLDNNIEIHFVLSNHSHVSFLSNKGIKWANFMQIDITKIKQKIEEDLYNMNKIKKGEIKIHILNHHKGEITLNEYHNSVLAFLNSLKFTKNDLIFGVGGVVKSHLIEELLTTICSKKVLLVMGRKEKINLDKYDLIATFESNVEDKKIKPLIPNLSPFFWETQHNIHLSNDEKKLLIKLETSKIPYLFITTKQKIASSLDQEFIDIMNQLAFNYPHAEFCLIGDNQFNLKNKLIDKIFFDFNRINVIEFSDSLYNFYRIIDSKVEALFIFPRISGGGTGNLMAANAGIPTVIFKGNDAEGTWLPSNYFVENQADFIAQIDKFFKNKNQEKQKFLQDFAKHKEKVENESKEICRWLLQSNK